MEIVIFIIDIIAKNKIINKDNTLNLREIQAKING